MSLLVGCNRINFQYNTSIIINNALDNIDALIALCLQLPRDRTATADLPDLLDPSVRAPAGQTSYLEQSLQGTWTGRIHGAGL